MRRWLPSAWTTAANQAAVGVELVDIRLLEVEASVA